MKMQTKYPLTKQLQVEEYLEVKSSYWDGKAIKEFLVLQMHHTQHIDSLMKNGRFKLWVSLLSH